METNDEVIIINLITSIELLIEKKNDVLYVIENPLKLIKFLRDLDQMVEMYEVKNSIVEQIQLLIVMGYKSIRNGKKNDRFEGHRLHTVFYGPPGVGKSKTALCLARIWDSLGILGELGDKDIRTDSTDKKIIDITDKVSQARSLVLELYSLYNPGGMKKTIEGTWAYSHPKWDMTLNILKEISTRSLEILHKPTEETPISSGYMSQIMRPASGPVIPASPISSGYTSQIMRPASGPILVHTSGSVSGPIPPSPISIPKTHISDNIVICSREDFIASYSGQTSEKSKNFLMSNLGKCIIIEEAYSLCNSDKDEYGKEALTVLNRFMEDYGNRVIIIFTGYRDQLMETIFTFQPGLIRRCQTSFEIKAYTPEGLASIFIKQIEKIGWDINISTIELNKFFTENYNDFPAFGGDTERLALHCKLAYGCDAFNNIMDAIKTSTPIEVNTIVTAEILAKAMIQYRTNHIETESS
jgi:hypothetical protein